MAYFPLYYMAGTRRPSDDILVLNESAVGGSLTMTSYAIGQDRASLPNRLSLTKAPGLHSIEHL
jgi:hypothetical protein